MAHHPLKGAPSPQSYQALDRPRRYPGRARVLSRDDARDYVFDRLNEVDRWRRNACLNPVQLPAIGLPSMREGKGPLPLTIDGRCRQCAACLQHRRQLWTARAVDEIAASSRTWFGTLTVRPEERVRLAYLAERTRLRAGGELLSSLDSSERFRVLADALGSEVTRWLKRVRSAAKQPLRYLLVAEAHKSGDPHMHILVHEPAGPIAKRTLEDQWRIGFSHWRLVGQEPGAATYVCKYLAKDALTRVRASQHYGQTQLVRSLTERIEKISAALCVSSEREGTSDDGVIKHSGDTASREGAERPKGGGAERRRASEASGEEERSDDEPREGLINP